MWNQWQAGTPPALPRYRIPTTIPLRATIRSLRRHFCGLDDRPPLPDLGPLQRAERLRGHLVARRHLVSEIDQALAQLGGGETFDDALSLATTSSGVPLGAQNPFQTEISNPGKPASAAVGTSGACGRRSLAKAA